MYEDGRLAVRPARPTHLLAPGVHRLRLRSGALARLFIPETGHGTPRPLAVMLHGAGGSAEHGLDLLGTWADSEGVVVLAPQSEDPTWDLIRGGYGTDVEAIDDLLAVTFARVRADPARLAIGGFSDGASYGLSLGMINGNLFTHVLAFSPGFAAPTARADSPRLFIAHGTDDRVLPIERCSGRLAPALQRAGYDVTYRPFEGGHTIPDTVRSEAVHWFLRSQTRERSADLASQAV